MEEEIAPYFIVIIVIERGTLQNDARLYILTCELPKKLTQEKESLKPICLALNTHRDIKNLEIGYLRTHVNIEFRIATAFHLKIFVAS
ncbi:hypothetical protein ACLOJK_013047 [Asimina triloba]